MPIRRYLDEQRFFDAETVRLLGIAFETAGQQMNERAKASERDPDRLCEAALRGLRRQGKSDPLH